MVFPFSKFYGKIGWLYCYRKWLCYLKMFFQQFDWEITPRVTFTVLYWALLLLTSGDISIGETSLAWLPPLPFFSPFNCKVFGRLSHYPTRLDHLNFHDCWARIMASMLILQCLFFSWLKALQKKKRRKRGENVTWGGLRRSKYPLMLTKEMSNTVSRFSCPTFMKNYIWVGFCLLEDAFS